MPNRIPEDQMPGLLRQPHPDVPLGLYEHTKTGNLYGVVGGTFRATGDSQKVCVEYISADHGYTAHRTPADFLEEVKLPGDAVGPRFRLIKKWDTDTAVVQLVVLLGANVQLLADL